MPPPLPLSLLRHEWKVTNEKTVSRRSRPMRVCLEEVGHAPAVLPTLLGHPAVPLDDDVDDLLLAGADVDNLHLAVFEAEDEVSTIEIPRRDPDVLTAFLNVN